MGGGEGGGGHPAPPHPFILQNCVLNFFQNKAGSYNFICVRQQSILFHFTLMLLKLEHALITADLLTQSLTKKVMFLYKNVLIRCCKWLSFQSAGYNNY